VDAVDGSTLFPHRSAPGHRGSSLTRWTGADLCRGTGAQTTGWDRSPAQLRKLVVIEQLMKMG
jgi:hypothetical protein